MGPGEAADRGGGHCACCGDGVALHAARPRVTTDGRIELQCEPCSRGERRVPVAAVESPIEPDPLPRRRPTMFAAGAGAAVLALVSLFGASGERTAASAGRPSDDDGEAAGAADLNDDLDLSEVARTESIELHAIGAAPTPPRPRELPPIPERDGEPIDGWYPTLAGWVHPVPGSPEVIPTKGTRIFGAHRSGVARADCGAGHCGVDLEGDRGQPVIAVAWGTVVRIQTDPDGRGGRYVKIEHPDYVYTSYFHLDAIAPGLEVGDELDPGAPVGTLGRSGIHISMPHLHFALELPDGGGSRFADPVPFLARAEVLERHAVPELDVKPPVDPAPSDAAGAAAPAGLDTESETSLEAEPSPSTAGSDRHYRSVTGASRP